MHHRQPAFSPTLALLALVLSFVLCACSEPTEDNPPETNNASSNNASSNNGVNNSPNNAPNNNALPCPQPNACGGCEPLEAQPGSPCGPCNDGTLACDGTDAFTCQNASNLNACGGCVHLEGAPDAPCGPCNDGTLACDGTDALTCQNTSGLNICGGCTHLEGAPGDRCGRCSNGTLACDGTDALACQGATDTCPREGDHCDDGDDNDGDGLVDCDDDECSGTPQCSDGSCVDVDLGSALGRPVTDITAAGWGNDLDDGCLGPEEDIVFRWTAPHDGVFAFDTPAFTLPLEVLVGDCASIRRWCEQGSYRSSVSLPLHQGDSVLIVTEGAATLGIKPSELPLELASVIVDDRLRDSLQITGDLTGDGLPEVLLGPGEFGVEALRVLPLDSPEPSLPNLALFPQYGFQRAETSIDGRSLPLPFSGEFDLSGDGLPDLYTLLGGEALVHVSPPDWEAHRWPSMPAPEGLWRPAAAWGDVTGDGLPDLVSWPPTADRWEIYDDARLAWTPERLPLASLDAPVNRLPGLGRPAAVCDFDGDGVGDLLLNSSELLLVPGPVTPNQELSAVAFPLGSLWPVDSIQDLFVVGDLDADGRCDVVLHSSPFGELLGEVRVFLGPLNRPLTPENATLRFTDNPDQGVRGLGQAVAVGDVNGDGLLDLALGAPQAHQDLPGHERSSQGGLVFIFFGPLEQTGQGDPFAADRILTNDEPGMDFFDPPTFGSTLALGDLDGDGMDEIVTTEASDNYTFIFSGSRITAGIAGQELQP